MLQIIITSTASGHHFERSTWSLLYHFRYVHIFWRSEITSDAHIICLGGYVAIQCLRSTTFRTYGPCDHQHLFRQSPHHRSVPLVDLNWLRLRGFENGESGKEHALSLLLIMYTFVASIVILLFSPIVSFHPAFSLAFVLARVENCRLQLSCGWITLLRWPMMQFKAMGWREVGQCMVQL